MSGSTKQHAPSRGGSINEQRNSHVRLARAACERAWHACRRALSRDETSGVGRVLARLERIPVGRKVNPAAAHLGLMQRWYVAQPTQRIVASVLELATPVDDEALAQALRQLCARHPSALGVCEQRTPTRLRLRPLTAAEPLPRSSASNEDVWSLTAAMLHRPFAVGAPLFRVAVGHDRRCLVSVFDHAIADGASAVLFARELACLLAGQTLPPWIDDALSLDARLDLRPSIGALLRSLRSGGDVLLAPQLSNVATPRRTGLMPRLLEHASVDALLARAREHGVTLHAVLASAALLAAAEVLDADGRTLRLSTPISLRERCSPRPMGMGVFIAGIDTDLGLSMLDEAWSIAQRCMQDLASKAPNAHRAVGLLAFAGDLTALARRHEAHAHGRTATVEVSNVGVVREVPSGAGIWMTQGAHYHAAVFVLSVATSDSDGALRCCLSFPEPLIDRACAARFMDAFERRLRDMRDTAN
jgi:hypothetical protein